MPWYKQRWSVCHFGVHLNWQSWSLLQKKALCSLKRCNTCNRWATDNQLIYQVCSLLVEKFSCWVWHWFFLTYTYLLRPSSLNCMKWDSCSIKQNEDLKCNCDQRFGKEFRNIWTISAESDEVELESLSRAHTWIRWEQMANQAQL